MSTDDTRLIELRRRVQEDPASMCFAPLAEELRRRGATEEAVAVCRAGLAQHPSYLTARVTLGRALVELDRLDEAFNELTFVLDEAPGNLPAIRALAEVYQRRGLMSEALVHYRRAMQLAQHDAELGRTVGRIEQQIAPAAGDAPAGKVEALFDFDALLEQFGQPEAAPPALPDAPPVPGIVESVALTDATDVFAVMERQLREREEVHTQMARDADSERRRQAVVRELEDWLAAIIEDRSAQLPQA
jgi:tetratricopeptide (TPR) repeat protein